MCIRDRPSDFVEDIKNFRIRGSSGKVNLALDALPNFSALPGDGHHLRGAISISPSYDHLEKAYDDAKYGNFSTEPYMDIILPSVLDPDMAPPGKHVMSCFVQYAPYNIKGGWNDDKRESFGDAVINTGGGGGVGILGEGSSGDGAPVYRLSKVGINNSNPSTQLDITGTVHATGDVDFDSVFTTLKEIDYHGDLIIQGSRIPEKTNSSGETSLTYLRFVDGYLNKYYR